MNQIEREEFENKKEQIAQERYIFNKHSLAGKRALIALNPNQLIRYSPADDEELFKPEYEIVNIDTNKIEIPKNKIIDSRKMDLVDFYKDGLLIRLDSLKTAFFTLKLHLPYEEKYKKVLNELKAYEANTFISSFSFNKNSTQCQHAFFVSGFFKKWTDKSFKDYLYVIVDSYSKMKAFKIPLKQFEQYEVAKKYFSNKTKAVQEEEYPNGYERSYFKKLLQNNIQWTHRATTMRLSKVSQKFALRLSWLGKMENSFKNYGHDFWGNEKEIWSKICSTKTERDRTENMIRIGLMFFTSASAEEIDKYIDEYSELGDKKVFGTFLNKKQTEFMQTAVPLFSELLTIKDEYKRRMIIFSLAERTKDFTYSELQQIFQPFLIAPGWRNSTAPNIYNAFHIWFHYFAKFSLLFFHTNYGKKLPSGRIIDYSHMTNVDAMVYWNVLPSSLSLNDYVEEHECPMILEENNIFNNSEDIDDHFKHNFSDAEAFSQPTIEKSVEKNIKEILSQALDKSCNVIPYKACVELKDNIFKYIRFVEEENEIHVFVYDENERFLYEVLEKRQKVFRGYLFDPKTMKDKNTAEICKNFYTAFATAIRDFKVTINRDVVLGPVRHRVPLGIKTNIKRIIYLPRIRYRRIKDVRPIENEIKLIRKSSGGFRSHHIRKLPATYQPSPLQIVLAHKKNIEVPHGHTYVRGSVVGQKNMTEDEIIYRSRNITSAIYNVESLTSKAHEIVNLSWAGFEEHCRTIVSQMGWDVGKLRVKDGGIDIEAYRSVIKNENEKLVRLFVQCKHQKKNVGPEILRELLGAKELEDKEYETELMIIASGKFSSGSILLAREKKIKLIDGNDLLKQK